MRAAASIADYVARPVGRCFAGDGFLHAFFDEQLCGMILWGRPDEAAVRGITGALAAELPPRGLHASFVDTRGLETIDPAAFRALAEHIGVWSPAYSANVTLHALIRPDGVIGAAVAGFYDVANSFDPSRTRLFTELEPALRWLGRDDAPAVIAAATALRDAATATPAIVRRVRDHVAAQPTASLRVVARALAVSTRVLQDQLRGAGTSFRREVAEVRVALAQRRMLESDAKLATIALEIGCASAPHFATLFRRVTGESPAQWRARAARPR